MLLFCGFPVSRGVLTATWLPFVAYRCSEAFLVPRGFPSWVPVASRWPEASLVPRGFPLMFPFVDSRCPLASLVPSWCPLASLCGFLVSRGALGAPWLSFVASRGFPSCLPGVPRRPWCPVASRSPDRGGRVRECGGGTRERGGEAQESGLGPGSVGEGPRAWATAGKGRWPG